MTREKVAWCSQRGVAQMEIAIALLVKPGTTLMRPEFKARIPARTTGAGCIISIRNCGVIFISAAFANPVFDKPGHNSSPKPLMRL